VHIVTGPPRSGTSFVCQLLSKLGVEFRADLGLIGADRWNPQGYFESKPIIVLNHRLMFDGLGNPEDWLASDWQVDRYRDLRKLLTVMMMPLTANPISYHRRAARMLGELEDTARKFHSSFAKDPRFCITLGAWLATGMINATLVCWRMPLTTAASLCRQTGYPKWLVRRVWADSLSRLLIERRPLNLYVLDAEKLMRPGTFVDEMKVLFAFAGVDYSKSLATEVWQDSFEPQLRHFDAESGFSRREARVLTALEALRNQSLSSSAVRPRG
jgi:hypothetical protein